MTNNTNFWDLSSFAARLTRDKNDCPMEDILNKNFFVIDHKSSSSKARAGRALTAHGEFLTPVFMPVATQATVKSLSSEELENAGVNMIISNAYHLFMRPGGDIIKKAGGLHKFMNWTRPITTDSGGFQVFSLALLRKIHNEGVEFRSHLDGTSHFFTPENIVDFQLVLDSDILMPLDECVKYPADEKYVEKSVDITCAWAKKSKDRFNEIQNNSFLFGIIQGSTYHNLRKKCANFLVELNMDGYALGGIGVGEGRELMDEITDYTCAILPENKIRYLMGVGTPSDILSAISRGVDMFDCVVPTRNARNGQAFTFDGELQLRNANFKEDFNPIEKDCACNACKNYSRAYIRHLFNTGEILAIRLITEHNIFFYAKLMNSAREAILRDNFEIYKKDFLTRFNANKTLG
ncbi:queuine tRNA-ribosyltransferase [Candidatus Omnitrophus magneticus]|uniref:Queuine tRNA-ribosyltransferase n=1 Tax=Candidatus Omnitrophus magneticus TaxID=1609969 RepID=A0A0F0CV19_9BACT|nr:queuine tRNA-ribosyltransferase [Candidatus Omnitrophus magneticus]